MSTATSVAVGSTRPLQAAPEGPASPVRYISKDGSGALVVPGTNIKLLPIPDFAKGEYDGSEEYKQFLRERTEWVSSVVKAGGRIVDAWQLLKAGGHLVTLKTLQSKFEKAERFGSESLAVEEPEAPPSAPAIDVEDLSTHGRAHSDTLSGVQMIIDAAVDRMHAELISEIEELKPKAAKWAQLRKIRDLLGGK